MKHTIVVALPQTAMQDIVDALVKANQEERIVTNDGTVVVIYMGDVAFISQISLEEGPNRVTIYPNTRPRNAALSPDMYRLDS